MSKALLKYTKVNEPSGWCIIIHADDAQPLPNIKSTKLLFHLKYWSNCMSWDRVWLGLNEEA